MEVRFFPDMKSARKVIKFRQLSKDEKNATFSPHADTTPFFKYTDDEISTRLFFGNYTQTKYKGSTAFMGVTTVGYISLYKDSKRMRSQGVSELVAALQRYPKVTKELGLDTFISHKDDTVMELERTIYRHRNVLKAIMRGNCTNKDDACRRYFKGMYGFNVGWKTLVQMRLKTDIFNATTYMLAATNFQNVFRFITQKAQLLNDTEKQTVEDLVNMSNTMCRKINFAWSMRRMTEEHDALSKVIAFHKANSMPLREVEYDMELPEIEHLIFLVTNRELVYEGQAMSHCVGSSTYYSEYLIQKTQLFAHYDDGEVQGTVQIGTAKDNNTEIGYRLRVHQFMLRFNHSPSPELREKMDATVLELSRSEFGQYFIKESTGGFATAADTELDWIEAPIAPPALDDEDLLKPEEVVMPEASGLPF